MRTVLLSLACLPVLLSSSANAETIIGQVVNSDGVPIASVNIDLVDSGGNDVVLSNDGTDLAGMFDTTLPGPGIYDIYFTPQNLSSGPFAITLLKDVTLSGVTDLGVIVLDDGAILSGRVLDGFGVGVAAVNLDLLDAQGVKREIGNDGTDSLGFFEVLAPQGAIELRFDTSGVPAPLLAPKALQLNLSGSLDIGDVVLAPGFQVLAVVRTPGGTGVSDADLDASVSLTGVKQYTPGDNTDNNGFVDFVVAAGTYDLEVCAQVGDRLVTKVVPGVVVAATTNLGIITMENGFILSGQVTNPQGAPLSGIDLDVNIAGTLISIPTCKDNTDASGNYAVVVPAGVFDLEFMDVVTSCGSALLVNDVSVSADTTQDAVLDNSFGSAYCAPANANSTGMPGVMSASGSCSVTQNNTVLIASQLPPNQFAFFLNSMNQALIQNPGGSQGNLCLGSSIGRYNAQLFNSGATGSGSLTLDLTQTPTPTGTVAVVAGQTWNFQCWHRDLNPNSTSNFTSALSILFQ
ncbi:MAG: hypothetical protein ACI8QC_002810 [Planctomycetota bacterium]|jgi:hypothetical protein